MSSNGYAGSTPLFNGNLRCNDFESGRALIGQASVSGLDLEKAIPDVMRYYFECPACGSTFGPEVETFHDRGGQWSNLLPC